MMTEFEDRSAEDGQMLLDYLNGKPLRGRSAWSAFILTGPVVAIQIAAIMIWLVR
jgi:hypothetical protein